MMLLAVGIAGTAFESRSNLTRGIPRGYPAFTVPADNPMSQAKVDLGRMLFYDRRLSFNGAIACASCHRQEFAFADPRPQSVGATGELTPRNAMTLTNVAFNARYTWANSTLETLEQQTVIPLTHEGPLEMGVSENEAGILDRFRNEPRYVELFAAAFPDEGGISRSSTSSKRLARSSACSFPSIRRTIASSLAVDRRSASPRSGG